MTANILELTDKIRFNCKTEIYVKMDELERHYCIGDSGYTSTTDDTKELVSAFRRNNSLITIRLNNMQEGIKKVVMAISKIPTLVNFELTCCAIDTSRAIQIAELIKHHKELKNLSLAHNRLGSAGIKIICDALLENTTLQSINLSGSSFYSTKEAITAVTHLMQTVRARKSFPLIVRGLYAVETIPCFSQSSPEYINHVESQEYHIKIFSELNARFRVDDRDRIMDYVEPVTFMYQYQKRAETQKALQVYCKATVHLRGNVSMDEEKLAVFLDRIKRNEIIELSIDLGWPTTRLSVALNFCKVLKENNSLRAVQFNGAPYITEGRHTQPIQWLVESLAQIKTLTTWRFHNLTFDTDLARIFSYHLNSSEGLLELDLASNCIDDAFIQYIAESLSRHPRIQRVNLSDNWIGNRGAMMLLKSLEQNDSIVELDLSHNLIDSATLVCIQKGLAELQQGKQPGSVGALVKFVG